jgi:hypothetical protein
MAMPEERADAPGAGARTPGGAALRRSR